jgi:glutaredoxin 3
MNLVSRRAVVIFSSSKCCMCHAIKMLFAEMGVNAAVYELDEESWGREMERALVQLTGRKSPVPVVFIAGQMVGSTEVIMSLHLAGKLVPLLREAGAIWL